MEDKADQCDANDGLTTSPLRSMKKARKNSNNQLIVINSLDEIPTFASEDEERAWWDTHEFSDELWDSLSRVSPTDLPIRQIPRAQVSSWDELPDFRSDEEERDWWENRVPSEALLDSLPERPIMPSRLETLRAFVMLGRKTSKACKAC